MVRKISAHVDREIVTCMTDRPSRSRGSHAARWSIAAVVACVLALPGCAKLGPDFKRPDVALADQWADAADPTLKLDATAAQAWWQVFGDPVLDRLVESAYRQNLNLRIAGVRVLEARAELGIAVGGRYPQRQQIGAGATYVSLSESAANTALLDLNYWEFDTGFDAAWELDFWGKFSRGIESADATLLGSIASYDNLLVTLIGEVATAYVIIRTFEERLAIARRNVAIQTRSVEIANVRFRNALTTELDVQQARSLLKNTEASIPVLQIGLRRAQNALSILLGQPPGAVQDLLEGEGLIPSPPAEVAVGIPAELLRRRPECARQNCKPSPKTPSWAWQRRISIPASLCSAASAWCRRTAPTRHAMAISTAVVCSTKVICSTPTACSSWAGLR